MTTQAVIASEAKQSPSRKEEIALLRASQPQKTLLAMTRAEQLRENVQTLVLSLSKQWELTVDGRLKNLATIADFVTQAAKASGLSEKATFEVQLAVDEACTNVIEHGYGEEEKGEITLCCEGVNDNFVVTIHDHGRPFDPEAIPPPDLTCSLAERLCGGLGLYFMRQLMDEVRFHFDAEGNKLTMIKKISR